MEIRKLTETESEIYAGAVIRAIEFIPSFRDTIALLRPFVDETATTAYTDRHARVGLSPWFFTEINSYQRASVILHEVMHVLYNHFVRGEDLSKNGSLLNMAGDFEINTGLGIAPKVDLSFAIFPDKDPFDFPAHLSMEQYYHLLSRDDRYNQQTQGGAEGDSQSDGGEPGEGSESSSKTSKSANPSQQQGAEDSASDGHYCDSNTTEREEAADAAGIARASEAEKSVSKNNTIVRVNEDMKSSKARGDGHMANFLEMAGRLMSPPKVSWRSIFQRVLARQAESISRGRSDYSYRKPNRRLSDSQYVFPGMIQYQPKAVFGIDTSGSMGREDFNSILNEVEGIIKSALRGKDSLKVFSVDTKIEGIKTVSKVSDIKLVGGGGTDMSIAVAWVNSLKAKDRPDIFVLATDGGTDWNSYEAQARLGARKYHHILLITHQDGYKSVPESLKKLVTVIDISDALKK